MSKQTRKSDSEDVRRFDLPDNEVKRLSAEEQYALWLSASELRNVLAGRQTGIGPGARDHTKKVSAGVARWALPIVESLVNAKRNLKIIEENAFENSKQHRYESSLMYYFNILERTPGCANAAMSLGCVHYNFGNRKLARKWSGQANRLDPGNHIILRNLDNARSPISRIGDRIRRAFTLELKTAEAIRIAQQAAAPRHYREEDFRPAKICYDSGLKRWFIYLDRKFPSHDYFAIQVDDQTKEATVYEVW